MEITKQTRREAYISRPVTRAADILEFMGDKEYTARQIAYGMGFTDLNAVKPRLTELKAAGLVEVAGKAYDETTKRRVAVWKAAVRIFNTLEYLKENGQSETPETIVIEADSAEDASKQLNEVLKKILEKAKTEGDK